MNKINIKINIDKIDRNKIKTRTYKNAAGIDVTVKEYEVELMPIREEKVVHSTPEYDIVKVGFLSERSVKNASRGWDNGTIIGDAVEIRNKEKPKEKDPFDDIVQDDTGDAVNVDDIPF